jgi:hypothetical protein
MWPDEKAQGRVDETMGVALGELHAGHIGCRAPLHGPWQIRTPTAAYCTDNQMGAAYRIEVWVGIHSVNGCSKLMGLYTERHGKIPASCYNGHT